MPQDDARRVVTTPSYVCQTRWFVSVGVNVFTNEPSPTAGQNFRVLNPNAPPFDTKRRWRPYELQPVVTQRPRECSVVLGSIRRLLYVLQLNSVATDGTQGGRVHGDEDGTGLGGNHHSLS